MSLFFYFTFVDSNNILMKKLKMKRFGFATLGMLIIAFTALFAVPGCQAADGKTPGKPYLIVLSMDGFRWDYPAKAHTPNLDKIAKAGVKADAIVPSFPTKTFPNHYTMATGLYPDNHGIVLNEFYDPERKAFYAVSDRKTVEDGSFYGGEPVWVTAENQGMKAATLFWVGSEAAIKGVRPSIWKNYKHRMPYESRIDTVISWLQLPDSIRPHLIMWYLAEPDGVGHDFGPDSPEIVSCVERLDSLLGVFMFKLQQLPIAAQVNFIATSDHGMCPISNDRLIQINQFVDTAWIAEIQGNNPVFTIKANAGFDDEIESALSKVAHLKLWRSGHLPERLHYGNNPRTLDFVVVADSSWSVDYASDDGYNGGAHGFDNANSDMGAIFYATGPAFKQGFVNGKFPNTDLYALMCEILKLNPAKTDGNLTDVKGMLK